MKNKKMIRLNVDQVSSFVNAASRCDFDIDIANDGRERMTVDAKSYLGVMGLDFKEKLIVSYYGVDDRFENYLASLAVAG